MKPDFGATATDYAEHRAGFPDSLFDRLAIHGLGRPGQDILDLGTGTGSLGRGFARRGCKVIGLDLAGPLLAKAQELDAREGVHSEYRVGRAEATGLPASAFDVVAAGQSWHWFDRAQAAAEAARLLRPNGHLLIAHFDWIPLPGNMVRTTEELIERTRNRWAERFAPYPAKMLTILLHRAKSHTHAPFAPAITLTSALHKSGSVSRGFSADEQVRLHHAHERMKAVILTCLVSVLLLGGCSKPEPAATFASAESFTKSLIEQLRQSGTLEEVGGAGGQTGNVYTRSFSRLLPAESFPPARLHDAAEAAMTKWGEYDTYSKRGSGGDDRRFRLHYGTDRTHAFIDVVAYPESDKTRVDFLIRVIE